MVLGLRVEKVGRREGLEYHYKSLKTGLRKGLPRVVGDASTTLSTGNSSSNKIPFLMNINDIPSLHPSLPFQF